MAAVASVRCWLVLVRDNGSLFAVTRIILHALVWGLSLTIIPASRKASTEARPMP